MAKTRERGKSELMDLLIGYKLEGHVRRLRCETRQSINGAEIVTESSGIDRRTFLTAECGRRAMGIGLSLFRLRLPRARRPRRPRPRSRRRRVRRLARRVPRALGLGQGRAQLALRELLVPGALRLERVREGRPGLARGAGRRLPAGPARRSRLQPARLPEGRLLQRAHVRRGARPLPAQARGPARLGASGSASPGTRRSRRSPTRCSRPSTRRAAIGSSGTTDRASRSARRLRAQFRLRALIDGTGLDMNTEIGDGHRGAAETFGKIVFERSADDYFFSDLIVCWGSNPYYTQIPNAHFPDRGALQRRPDRLHQPRLQRLVDPHRPLGAREAGLRRGARPRHRPRAGRGGAGRPRLRRGADRHALPGARRHRPVPADLGPGRGRRRGRALHPRREAGRGPGRAEHARAGRRPAVPRGQLRGDAPRRHDASLCGPSSRGCGSTWPTTRRSAPRRCAARRSP